VDGTTKAAPVVRDGLVLVGDTGIEPVTSSVSGKRATAAPIALKEELLGCCKEVEMGFEPTYTALQAAASPLGHSTLRRVLSRSREPEREWASERMTGFEPATLTLAR
jgi:hypothetical protein